MGDSIPMSFIYMYRTALGDFNTIDFDTMEDNSRKVMWFIFFVSTMATTIVLLNLLIAIMGDTYAQVMKV